MKLLDKDILYLDRQIVFVNKPSGYLTQSDERENLEDALQSYLQNYLKKSTKVFCKPAHRLDRGVSGIVVFARTSKSLKRLHALFREKKCQKVYEGLVEGVIKKPTTLKQHWEKKDHRAKIFNKPTPHTKEVILHIKPLKVGKETSLLEIDLETGRYHQIRAQLGSLGHPILGDVKYGAKPKDRIYLHHAKMSIEHPVSKERIEIRSASRFTL